MGKRRKVLAANVCVCAIVFRPVDSNAFAARCWWFCFWGKFYCRTTRITLSYGGRNQIGVKSPQSCAPIKYSLLYWQNHVQLRNQREFTSCFVVFFFGFRWLLPLLFVVQVNICSELTLDGDSLSLVIFSRFFFIFLAFALSISLNSIFLTTLIDERDSNSANDSTLKAAHFRVENSKLFSTGTSKENGFQNNCTRRISLAEHTRS